MLIRPRNLPEVYPIAAGVILLFAFRLISLPLAIHAAAKALDVCLFLIGMMLLSSLAHDHGVFDWLSSLAVRLAKNSSSALFALVYAAGTIVTIFMSNDATAIVLTPAVLTAVRKARVNPLPYVFVCAFIANAASFVLPISNPANLVVFHNHMPPLGRWLISFLLPSIASIAVTFLVMRHLFLSDLNVALSSETSANEVSPLTRNGKLVLAGIALMAAVLLIVSSLDKALGLPACLTALFIAAAVSLMSGTSPLQLAREISWETLALVVGLFIMVDAVNSIGALRYTQAWLLHAQQRGTTLGTLFTGFSVAIANNLVNNLPLGLIAGTTVQTAHATGLLANTVLIAIDLGPNLSITGSLATILWLIALRKENLNVTFWDFLKVGAIAMPTALLASLTTAILMTHL